ncbi:hypothetical protein EV401DRAFT_2075007 [Pisolithus croceorrhizus]|nr:hypothetical protein EV401DRAFT_2075007 [Pisolithus croceorrhizus]
MPSQMIALIFLDHANDTASIEEAEGSMTLFIFALDDPSSGLESPNRFVRLINRPVILYLEQLLSLVRLIQPIVAFARATVQEAVDRRTTEADQELGSAPVFLEHVRPISGLKALKELLVDIIAQALELAVIDVLIISNYLRDILSHKKELKGDGVAHNI